MRRYIVCLTLIVILLTSGCDGGTRLQGEVVDADNKPVAEAKVRLCELNETSRSSDSKTDESGRYTVMLMHAPFKIPLVVTVTKDGYKPFRKEFKAGESEGLPKKIVLGPEPAPNTLPPAKD
jgi:hypothetical protein